MKRIVGIKFAKSSKVYWFDPDDFEDLPLNTNVIVETIRGVEMGQVVLEIKEVEDSAVTTPLRPILRIATDDDRQRDIENKERCRNIFQICKEKIAAHRLEMKLIDVECTFDYNKILFYFTADGRVDFRELVRDLAAEFKTRIELRQIGVRDETKMLGGVGMCGRVLCCTSFLSDFYPVSIRMAKEQNLSLNPTKISGMCGRLMCCLNYEQKAYEDVLKRAPKVGSVVKTKQGNGVVEKVDLLKERVNVKMDNPNEPELLQFSLDDIKVLKKPVGRKKGKKDDSSDKSIDELKQLED